MKTKSAYLKPISINAFHHPDNIYGLITNIEFITPSDNYEERLCYKVYYLDRYDYVPVLDVEDGIYKIVNKEKIPFHEKIYDNFNQRQSLIISYLNREFEEQKYVSMMENKTMVLFNEYNKKEQMVKTMLSNKEITDEEYDLYKYINFFDYIHKYGIDKL